MLKTRVQYIKTSSTYSSSQELELEQQGAATEDSEEDDAEEDDFEGFDDDDVEDEDDEEEGGSSDDADVPGGVEVPPDINDASAS